MKSLLLSAFLHLSVKTTGKMYSSGGDGDDLEDGEIFDDEDDTPAPTQPAAPTATSISPVPPPPPVISSLPDEKKKQLSPVRKTMVDRGRQRRGKRPREDERPFKNNKQRRRSDDSDKGREKSIGDDDCFYMEEDLRGPDWEGGHHRPNHFLLDLEDDLDDDEEDLLRRRGFGNRNRRGRNGRGGGVGGRRGIGRRENGQICKFYLQGKCQRGAECPFSHSQRKYEVCKFYMNDCCAKKDRCLFLHSEFPCKYHYLGMKCYAGKKCKFSHTKISSHLRANLLRDSKECEFLQHIDSPPPEKEGRSRRERERDRDRDRDHRDRDHRDKDREKEKAKERERERAKRDDKFTLHFKVDPRTISDEEEGNRTPMPSPSADSSSDRGSRSPEVNKGRKQSPKAEISKAEPKDNGVSDELPDFIPADLPKHQRELYKRIHLQQREVSSVKTEENEIEKETEDYKEEDWYSSEEEEDSTKKMEPITAIINKLKQPPAVQRPPSPPKETAPPQPLPVSSILTNIDVNAVFKLLSTVHQTIKLKEQQSKEGQSDVSVAPVTTGPPVLGASPSVPSSTVSAAGPAVTSVTSVTTQLVPSTIQSSLNQLSSIVSEPAPPAEKRRMRDPRLRGNSTEDDVDLRMGPRADVDLRQLPFKPAPIHPPASEIDASVTSHPPVVYRLIPISPPPPPDYSNVHSKNINDPRLKKHIPGALTNLQSVVPPAPGLGVLRPPLEGPRDPRQRIMAANDPRRKSSLLLQRDSDLRQPQQSFNLVNDVDLRMHPPAPHLAFK